VNTIVELKSSIGSEINESKIQGIAVEGLKRLLSDIFKLPSEYHGHIPVAKLPEGTTVVPREKHVPKPKPPTKWEKFAKSKGIQHRKKDKLVWDDTSKDWKPQYGYRSASNNKKTDWLVEVPDNADPNVDYLGKKKEEKKEKIAKNEYQRLRNIAATQKMKVTNLESVDRADKHQLSRSLAAAKTATASIGRFTDKLPKERKPKNLGKKRKFKPNTDSLKSEKENNMKILQQLHKKKPKLDVQEAVQKYLAKPLKNKSSEEQKSASMQRKNARKNRFKKNVYRTAHKKGFKRPV